MQDGHSAALAGGLRDVAVEGYLAHIKPIGADWLEEELDSKLTAKGDPEVRSS
jgi:hypothetical protein